MKFRYKVLIINMILLSVGISIVGFFMIDKNIHLALETQIKNAVDENNLLQSTLQYKLLGNLDSPEKELPMVIGELSQTVASSVTANNTNVYVLYNNELVFSNDENTSDYVTELFAQRQITGKQYFITHDEENDYLYIISTGILHNTSFAIVNQRNITEVYKMMQHQIQYFILLLLLTIGICSIFMYIISYLLTHPLEDLSRISKAFGEGDYQARANITTKDEIGELSQTYNEMAHAVETYIDELEDNLKRQEQFIADFTHEVKTPMTSIIGYADTLRSMELSRENQILASTYIFKEGKRLETMSMKLFDLILTKQKPVDMQSFHVEKFVDSVAESITPLLEQKSISLHLSCEPAILTGDCDLLKSAFINLIDNARKASQPNSEIHFTGTANEDSYTISVQDFGFGIPKEHLNKIQDAFYMVDKSRSRKEGGAGLGLSLASLIFSQHNAKFEIESEINVGTKISITFQKEMSSC